VKAKRLWYRDRGEPIQYGQHRLRYVPGTRPVRLKYQDSPDVTVRNDVKQIYFFLENVKCGDFVLDIGGHFGQYAILLSSLVSNTGRVITFEPDPLARKVLSKNIELNGFAGRVEVVSLALFDAHGQHSFFSNGADSMSSLARSGLGTNAFSAAVSEYAVKTERLDDYLSARKLGYPRFIKLDTEAEAEDGMIANALKVGKMPASLRPYYG